MVKVTGIACALVFVCGMIAWGSPPVGVTPTLLARGTYGAFRVKTAPHELLDVDVKAKSPLDIVVRQHDYQVERTTGWHTHPGPVFITVVQGEVTFYEYDDPRYLP